MRPGVRVVWLLSFPPCKQHCKPAVLLYVHHVGTCETPGGALLGVYPLRVALVVELWGHAAEPTALAGRRRAGSAGKYRSLHLQSPSQVVYPKRDYFYMAAQGPLRTQWPCKGFQDFTTEVPECPF